MDCKKYTLSNTGSTLVTFNYRRCDDAMWEYQVPLKPAQTKNIWLIDGTYSTAFPTSIVFGSQGVFPPPNPIVDINLFAGFYPGSTNGGFSATASSPVDTDVTINFICSVDAITGSPLVVQSSVIIPKGQTNGFTQVTLDYDYNNLTDTTSFTNVFCKSSFSIICNVSITA